MTLGLPGPPPALTVLMTPGSPVAPATPPAAVSTLWAPLLTVTILPGLPGNTPGLPAMLGTMYTAVADLGTILVVE